MTTENRFFNETFQAAVGSLARGAAHNTQYELIQAGFKAVQDELDALQGITGITGLEGFPASFAGAALKYLRVNAAESAIEFVSGGNVGIKVIAGTSYTLVPADAGQLLVFTNDGAITLTVPADVMLQGDVVCVFQDGEGQVTVQPDTGVSLLSSGNLLSTRAQYAQIALVCHDAVQNTFGVIGERNTPDLVLYTEHQLACSDLTTDLTAATNVGYFRVPRPMQNVSVRASLLTASSSGVVTVDINRNGASILSTKLTIDANEKTSVTAATAAVLTTTTLSDDDEITIDIDTAGTGAKGLIVTVMGEVA